jgi:hypothetical protein
MSRKIRLIVVCLLPLAAIFFLLRGEKAARAAWGLATVEDDEVFVSPSVALQADSFDLTAAPLQPLEDLPDLVLDTFTMEPERPQVDQPVTITTQIRNAGTGDAPGWRVNLYVDPPDHPPTSTTPYSKTTLYGITFPPGGTGTVTLSGYTFTEPGCHHVVYAWADPREGIEESDETNNMRVIHLCVDPATPDVPGEDSYEPDDDCVSEAKTISTDGTPQVRSFVPLTDTDYVKFNVAAAGAYTITAAGTGQDAKPNLELSDSCDFAPPFGTTTRLAFTAPDAGTYYLKLTNNASNPDPNETTYQLTVQSDAQVTTGDPPIPLGITPISGTNDVNTNVVITGTQFVFPTMAELCRYQGGACTAACSQLLNTSWVGPQKLYATVPAIDVGADPPMPLELGAYCLQLTNPGGKSGALADAFTVLPSDPQPLAVIPGQGYGDTAIDLHIYGFNFMDGVSMTLGAQGLQNVQVINGTHAIATLPKGQSSGVYDLTASYASGATGSLADAFTVLKPKEDLYAQAEELWHNPVAPRVDVPLEVGLVVHRRGGVDALANLPVRFTVDGPGAPADPMTGTVALLAVDGQASTAPVIFTPTVEGAYTVTAEIDPNQSAGILESTRVNNTAVRTLSVLPNVGVQQAPHVDDLTINGAHKPTVSTRDVLLSVTATVPSGAVAEIRYIEFEYNQGAGLWVPVQDSRWLNYTLNRTHYNWTLTPVGGLHYVQAWARDGDGNISQYPYQEAVTYLKPTEWVGRDQARVYRRSLTAGETLHVTLTPVSGDPDLYIWPPDWENGRPPWVSNLSGSDSVDEIAFTAPVSGEYQVEVYGYTSAEYQLSIDVSALSQRALADLGASRFAATSDKLWPLSPVLPVNSAPPANYGDPLPNFNPTAPDGVTIVSDTVGSAYVFTATVTPAGATRPLYYRWEATGSSQAPVTHTVTTLSDTHTFSWGAAGPQTVTVTAINAGGQVTGSRTVDVADTGHWIYLPLVMRE